LATPQRGTGKSARQRGRRGGRTIAGPPRPINARRRKAARRMRSI